ncbi:MAG: hypothetical protein HAW67_06880 [Endozoicomonadaceae bacterium]|nr:hypothetical protein [Endozoicomonadaceae bacterium]
MQPINIRPESLKAQLKAEHSSLDSICLLPNSDLLDICMADISEDDSNIYLPTNFMGASIQSIKQELCITEPIEEDLHMTLASILQRVINFNPKINIVSGRTLAMLISDLLDTTSKTLPLSSRVKSYSKNYHIMSSIKEGQLLHVSLATVAMYETLHNINYPQESFVQLEKVQIPPIIIDGVLNQYYKQSNLQYVIQFTCEANIGNQASFLYGVEQGKETTLHSALFLSFINGDVDIEDIIIERLWVARAAETLSVYEGFQVSQGIQGWLSNGIQNRCMIQGCLLAQSDIAICISSQIKASMIDKIRKLMDCDIKISCFGLYEATLMVSPEIEPAVIQRVNEECFYVTEINL